MTEPRIVSPKKAPAWLDDDRTRPAWVDGYTEGHADALATEPNRTRALRQRAEKAERAWGEEAEMHTRKVQHIAGETDRTRAAVVKALNDMAQHVTGRHLAVGPTWIRKYADAIENGAEW